MEAQDRRSTLPREHRITLAHSHCTGALQGEWVVIHIELILRPIVKEVLVAIFRLARVLVQNERKANKYKHSVIDLLSVSSNKYGTVKQAQTLKVHQTQNISQSKIPLFSTKDITSSVWLRVLQIYSVLLPYFALLNE